VNTTEAVSGIRNTVDSFLGKGTTDKVLDAVGLDSLMARPTGLDRFGSQPGSTYTVKAGDTLSSIAKEHNTTWQKLAAHNGLNNQDANHIRPGQQIKLPQGLSTTHTVKPGETLSQIAAANGTTVQALKAANPQIKDSDRIYPGQVVRIGGGGAAQAQPKVAKADTTGASKTDSPVDATTKAQRPSGSAHELGELSKHYETGGRGPGTVSTGKGDKGGVSYGSYQLASKLGRPAQFLAKEGSRWAKEFGGAKQGSAEFTRVWKEIAKREPAAFQAAQHAYIERTHYNVQVDHVRTRTGVDLTTHSAALQDVVWSTAVHHGPDTNVIVKAMANVKMSPTSPGYDKALIDAIYAERGKRNASGELAYFSGNSAKVQAGVADRFVNERKDAQAMLARENAGVGTAETTARPSAKEGVPSVDGKAAPTGKTVLENWPVSNPQLNRADKAQEGDGHYGTRRSAGKHGGIDLVGKEGSPIFAAGSGRVVDIRPNPSTTYGYQVVIDHGNGVFTQYAHLKEGSLLVKPGDRIEAGDQIAGMGRTGNTPKAGDTHLHFEVRIGSASPAAAGGKTVDPLTYLGKIGN
jgi:murein DD-endopeptidase MepM/ murein hydrolase activator NlpD